MNLRNLAITSMILLGMLALYAFVSQGGAMSGAAAPGGTGRPEAVTYSQLLQQVQAGQVKEATIRGEDVTGVYKDDRRFTSVTVTPSTQLVDAMMAAGVNVDAKSTRQSWWASLLIGILPIALLVGVWIFFMRQMQGGARGAMGFGKSKAKLLTEH
ncbi:MAG: cell division protein FtsH, partial [Brevundimonas sp.]